LILLGLVLGGLSQFELPWNVIDTDVLIYVFIGLAVLPIVALLIGFVVIRMSHHQLHYFPQEGDEAFVWLHQTPQAIVPQTLGIPTIAPIQPQQTWMQYTVGLLEATLIDFSTGIIHNPGLYHPEFQQSFIAILNQLQVYLQRGWIFHFELYTHEPYQVILREQLSPTECVTELTGLCNYYYERDGESHPTPHSFDTSAPLIRVPTVFRLRLIQSPQTGQWQLAGLYESITGSAMGLTTG
jgi:hypothetical protein